MNFLISNHRAFEGACGISGTVTTLTNWSGTLGSTGHACAPYLHTSGPSGRGIESHPRREYGKSRGCAATDRFSLSSSTPAIQEYENFEMTSRKYESASSKKGMGDRVDWQLAHTGEHEPGDWVRFVHRDHTRLTGTRADVELLHLQCWTHSTCTAYKYRHTITYELWCVRLNRNQHELLHDYRTARITGMVPQ